MQVLNYLSYMKVKVNNKFDDKMNAKPRVFNYNCDCK